MKPVIVNFCPTGMVPTKAHTPHVPVSVREIIEQTHQAFETGITIAHLHARGADEAPSCDLEIYRDIIEGVRKHCPGLVICASTSGRTFSEFEKRSAVIELGPDMCSLTLSSLNFYKSASVNSPDMICRLAEKMNAFGVKQELECFDLGMINFGRHLIKQGLLHPPFYWNLIFGNIAGFQLKPAHIRAACEDLEGDDNHIAFGGIGKEQLPANRLAIEEGFGVRIGLEDNIWFDAAKTRMATNQMLLQRVHLMMAETGRELFPASAFGKLGFYNANTPARI